MAFRIPACNRVPADQNEIREHAEAVADDVNFRSRIVRPSHRYFHGSQSVSFREEQNFRIESEALDTLLLENDSRTIQPECLEAALRVFEGEPGEEPDAAVENNSSGFAKS